MKKSNKVLLIVLLSLLVACGIAYMVLYCIYPANTQRYTWLVFDYVCNKPLPVIGISALMLAVIIFKIVKFVINNRNTKIGQLKEDLKKLKDELLESKKEAEIIANNANVSINQLNEKINALVDFIEQLYKKIPNKKVKALGDEFYASEEKAD